MADPSLLRILDLFLNDYNENEPIFELPRKESTATKKPYGYCSSNGKLLEDVIAELDESNREPAYATSPEADVCNLYLEDLAKIQDQLSVEEQRNDVSNNGAQRMPSIPTKAAKLAVERKLDFATGELPFAASSKGSVASSAVPDEEEENVDFIMVSSLNNISTYLDCTKPLISAMSFPNPHNSQQQQPILQQPQHVVDIQNPVIDNIYSTMYSMQQQQNPSNTSEQWPLSNGDVDAIMGYVNEINEMTFSRDVNNHDGDVKSTTDFTSVGSKRAGAFLDPVAFPAESSSMVNSIRSMKNFTSSLVDADLSTSESDEADTPSNLTNNVDKKTVRKIKNNAASRVHRAKKKKKFEGLFQMKDELEKRNAELKIQAESMQKEADFLRELLLVKVAASSKP